MTKRIRKNEYNDQAKRYHKDWYQQRANGNPAIYLLQGARQRARRSGIECSIILDDINVPEVCPVFKTPFVRNTRYAASLDRIDSTKGYTKDNIQVISRLANVMKYDADLKELKQFAEWIIKGENDG